MVPHQSASEKLQALNAYVGYPLPYFAFKDGERYAFFEFCPVASRVLLPHLWVT